MEIPQSVQKAARERMSLTGGRIVLLTVINGADIYALSYDEEMTIGLPEYYVYKDGKVEVVSGVKALEITSQLE